MQNRPDTWTWLITTMQQFEADNHKYKAIFVSHSMCIMKLTTTKKKHSLSAMRCVSFCLEHDISGTMAIHRPNQQLKDLRGTAPAAMEGDFHMLQSHMLFIYCIMHECFVKAGHKCHAFDYFCRYDAQCADEF